MKNWKVSLKLIAAFSIVILLAFTTSGIGFLGMQSISNANKRLYERNVVGLATIGRICTNLLEQRVALRSILLYANDATESVTALGLLSQSEEDMEAYIQAYQPTLIGDEGESAFHEFTTKYYGEFAESKKTIKRIADSNKLQSSSQLLKTSALDEEMDNILNSCYEYNLGKAESTVSEQEALFREYALYQLLTLLFAVLISLLIGFLLNQQIAVPLRKMVTTADHIALGDMDVDMDIGRKDEVGELANAFQRMAAKIKSQALSLQLISEGDLTADIVSSGKRDMIASSLRTVSENLNRILHEILSASVQVSAGANQVSDGSQVLAQGTSEQATVIEQLSSSVFEISLNTKENAKMAEKAAVLYTSIKERAQESTDLMREMMRAVEDINEASISISKIIRLINDIAFQTNILSLNAAVEAANAGQHGKGFAVVAGEVRNLAAKSSQAAADTDALIENSMEKARLGAGIAKKTQSALDEIVKDILRSAELINDIAKATNEQALGVEQINVGIDQVAQVVSMNSTTAEQSAATAEEMAAQANAMEQLVSSFKLKESAGGTLAEAAPAAPPAHVSAGERKKPKKPVIILQEHPEKY